jgi:hypothetical protein
MIEDKIRQNRSGKDAGQVDEWIRKPVCMPVDVGDELMVVK